MRFTKLKATAAVGFLLIAGCATTPPVSTPIRPAVAVSPSTVAHVSGRMIVFIPQTDASAIAGLKLFDRYPHLRMVIAMSPRFQPAKDPAIKLRVNALLQSHRLAIGLQLPNPPILPLLIDTNSAKDSLPLAGELPNPPFAYQEDVIQIMARAKADFFRSWSILPRGLVLPYGAISPGAVALLDQQGFAWGIAALGAPPTDGAYHSGSLFVWDATPHGTPSNVLVCDERSLKESTKGIPTINAWAQALERDNVSAILPSDIGFSSRSLPTAWSRRTWTQSDWASWIGDPKRNAAWQWLRKTREALENYKNSGSASLQRLDQAFEEIYTAENANYFSAPGSADASPAALERVHDFQATLSTVFRLIGRTAPDDLFNEESSPSAGLPHISSTTAEASVAADGTEHVLLTDAVGDDQGDGKLKPSPETHAVGAYDLKQFEVWASSETLIWSVTMAAAGTPLVDIYVDLNAQPGLGTVALLPGRNLTAAPSDAWEYALTLYNTHATLYRTLSGGTYDLVGTFPLLKDGATLKVVMPRQTIHGRPRRWGYQVLVMARDPASSDANPNPWTPADFKGLPIYDLLDPLEVSQTQLLSDIESGARSDLPFIRVSH